MARQPSVIGLYSSSIRLLRRGELVMNVFVDANIFIRVATQGRPGCEHEHFKDLRTLVKDGTFTLLVPEVVFLEVEKAFRSLAKELESNCDKLSDSLRKATDGTWNEIDSLKTDVLDHIKQSKQERIAACEILSKDIVGFLESNAVTRIPLTPDILVSAKRRHIAGKMPNCKKSSDQDALIVESLISYLRGSKTNTPLLFCTENTTDFALEVDSKSWTALSFCTLTFRKHCRRLIFPQHFRRCCPLHMVLSISPNRPMKKSKQPWRINAFTTTSTMNCSFILTKR